MCKCIQLIVCFTVRKGEEDFLSSPECCRAGVWIIFKHHRVAVLKARLFNGGELGAADICLNQFAAFENEKQAGGIMLQMRI